MTNISSNTLTLLLNCDCITVFLYIFCGMLHRRLWMFVYVLRVSVYIACMYLWNSSCKSGVFNYDKFKKVLANDRDNDRLWYSVTVLLSVTHFQCTCTYAMEIPKQIFAIVCHINKCADVQKKREYHWHSLSVNRGIFYHRIFSVARNIGLSIPGWVAILPFPVVSRRRSHLGHSLWTPHGRKP